MPPLLLSALQTTVAIVVQSSLCFSRAHQPMSFTGRRRFFQCANNRVRKTIHLHSHVAVKENGTRSCELLWWVGNEIFFMSLNCRMSVGGKSHRWDSMMGFYVENLQVKLEKLSEAESVKLPWQRIFHSTNSGAIRCDRFNSLFDVGINKASKALIKPAAFTVCPMTIRARPMSRSFGLLLNLP